MDLIFSATIVVGFWVGSGDTSFFFARFRVDDMSSASLNFRKKKLVLGPSAAGLSADRCIIRLGIEPGLPGSCPDLIFYFF